MTVACAMGSMRLVVFGSIEQRMQAMGWLIPPHQTTTAASIQAAIRPGAVDDERLTRRSRDAIVTIVMPGC